ncbi:hypothetical protein V2J09_001072 [Rumex salicifolius]
MGSRASSCMILNFVFVLTLTFSSIGVLCSSSCHPQSVPFIYDLKFQCPVSISSSHPIQINGEVLEKVLSSKAINSYTAVLLYDSSCPFSSSFRDKFNMLSSMFPQIEHIEVEQSSVMPSLLSRYGVHSMPALLIINQTSNVRCHCQKNLPSLAKFYQKTTGHDIEKDASHYSTFGWLDAQDQKPLPLWYQASSWKEMIVKEPYLFFAISFLILRVFLCFCPQMLGGIMALWKLCNWHLNLGIFGESRLLLGRIMQIVDFKRVGNKIKWCKTGNFHNGARSARVWASSLASVSLGETSSARPASTMLDS